MKIPFENFDGGNPAQKISILEKTIIIAVTLFSKAVLWKIRKAKTYGDLYKLAIFIENKVQDIGDSVPRNLDDNKPNFKNIVTSSLDEVTKATKELKDS